MAIPSQSIPFNRRGISGFVSSFEFFITIKNFKDLHWILNYGKKSPEMEEFFNLIQRVKKKFTDYISLDDAVELFPNHKFNKDFPWCYTNEIVCIILTELKYNRWNQYYYSHMDDERLNQMIDWAYKEYRKNCLIDDISQDFN